MYRMHTNSVFTNSEIVLLCTVISKSAVFTDSMYIKIQNVYIDYQDTFGFRVVGTDGCS